MDLQIKSCSEIIQAAKDSQENLAIAFYNRALAYESKDNFDYEHAVADYTESIRLNPKDADAFFYRGLDRGRLGDKSGAEADLAEAKRLNPNIGQ